jgi:hypothetical protein
MGREAAELDGPDDARDGEDALHVEPLSAGLEQEPAPVGGRATATARSPTPAASCSSLSAAVASSPDTVSGSRSGVTAVTVTSPWPIARASPAGIKASS